NERTARRASDGQAAKEGAGGHARLGERASPGWRARSSHGWACGGPQGAHITQRPTCDSDNSARLALPDTAPGPPAIPDPWTVPSAPWFRTAAGPSGAVHVTGVGARPRKYR